MSRYTLALATPLALPRGNEPGDHVSLLVSRLPVDMEPRRRVVPDLLGRVGEVLGFAVLWADEWEAAVAAWTVSGNDAPLPVVDELESINSASALRGGPHADAFATIDRLTGVTLTDPAEIEQLQAAALEVLEAFGPG